MPYQKVLSNWAKVLRRHQYEHDIASRTCEKWSWRLGVPAIMCSATAAAFAALKEEYQFWTALISASAAILSGMQTFMNQGQRAREHKTVAAKFGELGSLSEIASLRPIDETAGQSLLSEIQTKWAAIQAEAPTLRASIIRQIEAERASMN